MKSRVNFMNELQDLRYSMADMGMEIEEILDNTLEVLINNNTSLVEKVVEGEKKVDDLELEIQRKCVLLITKEQPIAKDLRLIMSVIKIITDMERISDQCQDICSYYLKIKDAPYTEKDAFKRHTNKMMQSVSDMLSRTLEASKQKDIDTLREVCEYDDTIDDKFTQIWKELIEYMQENTNFISVGPQYIMIIKYLERIADHITNISEWMIYNLTGEYI
ncbi:MAG: phosphate transport system regulatory protein PhoU [Epulopiscium sp. Nuni2H_MBin003]|nr:MAG: phosphate transport system regulatory protein PhoU [Epulopiscium sp. Nuni2H_MBin003]